MKKALSLVLEDDELIELMRILLDDDADGARSIGRQLKGPDRCARGGYHPS